LHTSFNRGGIGSVRKIHLFFEFVVASRKTLFYISVMSHNAEVKQCNFYQFAEAFNGIASCKIFCPFFMFHHFRTNCIWLMLFLHELKQVFVLVKQFSFINRNVSLKQILSHGSVFSHSVVCKRRNLDKAFQFSK